MSYQYQQFPRTYDNRLEAVIVCTNYGDFLAETLPLNLPHFDRVVVVTAHDDHETRGLCAKWSVECILTDTFTEKGEPFNKGAALNIGIGALRQLGWIVQMDADIAVPQTFRNMLDKSALQPGNLYGCERANVVGWKLWAKLKQNWAKEPQFGYRYLVSTGAEHPIGANLVHKQFGYCPIGFFQLWHSSYMHQYELRYPDTEGSAECTDVQWALRWPRKNRLMLPTVRVYHLESELTRMGANWHGRKTKPFTYDGKKADVDAPVGYKSYVI